MSVVWTEDQKKVINIRNRNLLVSAAAGSGKTAVLVERIVSLITDKDHPVDVDRLLITTFTKAGSRGDEGANWKGTERAAEERPP